MRGRALRLIRTVVLVGASLLVAGCVTKYLPEPGKGPPAVSPIKAFSMGDAPVKGEAARFAFAPVTGAPSSLITALNSAIVDHAKERGVTIVQDGDPTAVYTVRGYLSAVGDSQNTLLVYVWDVFDRDGRRLHRFSGQETGSGSVVDPWQGIKEATVRDAARSAIDDLKAWSD